MADTADEYGNNLSAVSVPTGGLLAYAPLAAANVISDDKMGATPLALPEAYKKLGLVKVDGAPQDQREDGDRTELWQDGYFLAGDGSRSVTVSLAEDNEAVQLLIEGKTPDENGVVYVDSSLPDAKWVLFQLTRYKNGTEQRRNGVVSVKSVEVDQETRGDVRGRAVTLQWEEDDLFNGSPFKQWFGKPGSVAGSQSAHAQTFAMTGLPAPIEGPEETAVSKPKK